MVHGAGTLETGPRLRESGQHAIDTEWKEPTMAVAELSTDRLHELLGDDADDLLNFSAPAVSKDLLHLPGPDFVDRIVQITDRNPQVIRNLQVLYDHGRLGGTGYVSILPIDQGIEHSAGASFAPNPLYFDPENLVRLAMEGGCNAIASTVGVLGAVSRRYAHRIPFIVKLNHNELLTYPNEYDQVQFASVRRAWELGASGVGATIYFGSDHSRRQIVEIAEAFEEAHELGMYTVLWCYLRSDGFKVDGVDYTTSADLTGQANHIGTTIEADIIKQKLATNNGGYNALNQNGSTYGKTNKLVYDKLTTDHPIDLCRWQVINCYSGRAPLINSGGASAGESDLAEALTTAVINKRAGGTGLISGRKAFQRPMDEGIALLHAIQDVYLNEAITIA
jgi:fructose-bisphosphate aldolase, class I